MQNNFNYEKRNGLVAIMHLLVATHFCLLTDIPTVHT